MDLKELDRQVAEALEIAHCVDKGSKSVWLNKPARAKAKRFHPSTNGQQAIDLMREYGVGVMPTTPEHTTWQANFTLLKQSWSGLYSVQESVQGPTPEIAICKAIVAMKGEE